MRICNRCRKETEAMFCPTCHVLTYPPRPASVASESSAGDSFECTIWQGPSRTRGIEVPIGERNRFFSKSHDVVVLHIEGRRTVAKLGQAFWKKPAVIKKALSDDGKDQLIKFFEKHHLLPPRQSMKEKGVVDTVLFEVVTPMEEFKISVTERPGTEGEEETD
ncbi:MAG: hypothetical protein ACUVT7_07380 [Thermoplasmata archaeon]